MASISRISVWLAVAVVAAAIPAVAQSKKPAPAASNTQQGQPPAIAPTAVPDAYKLNLLIRSSIIALNQANQTGNYTVLQDLAAPAFRAANDSARLAQIFANLRQRNLDLTPTLFFTPKLVAQPQINPQGILRLVGYFPTAPERVNFELYFQMVANEWRLFGIGVTTSPAEVTAATPPQPQNSARTDTSSEGIVASVAPNSSNTAAQAQSQTQPAKPPSHTEPVKSSSRKPAAKNGSEAATHSAVQNGTTNNATRIDLAKPQPAESGASAENAAAEGADAEEKPKSEPSFWDSLFSRN